jgi:hypothetical protein
VKVSVVLAERGTTNPNSGTLNLLGAGWRNAQLQQTPAGVLTTPHVVVVFFEVDYSDCNHVIELELALLTEDAKPVYIPGLPGDGELKMTHYVTVPSPGGAPMGTPGHGNAMVEIFPGLPLSPGGYRWHVSLAGKHEEEWFAAFRVMPLSQGPAIVFGTQPSQIPPSTTGEIEE